MSSARGAPVAPLHDTPKPGFSDVPGWRVYGQATGHDGQMVYVAQTTEERVEAGTEIALAALFAGAPMTLLAVLWLRSRIRRELQPLRDLSERLAHYDPMQPGATLGPAEREELRPVHAAIDALAGRLTRRIAHERAFTSHAAHALRTPLAGIDAQLAVALREAEASHRPRLQRVRTAAERLQRVVVALLAMFRSGAEVQRSEIDVGALAARLPIEGLVMEARGTTPLNADADLLTAAVLNLIDNAQRHGARSVTFSTPAANVLRVHDDGPGVDPARRRELRAAIDAQDYAGRTGLGLMLADLVARAHGGGLSLPDERERVRRRAGSGNAGDLILGPRSELPAPDDAIGGDVDAGEAGGDAAQAADGEVLGAHMVAVPAVARRVDEFAHSGDSASAQHPGGR